MTILVVEDDEGINELLKERLGTVGHSVVCMNNGGDALSYLEDHTPYLLVLDYNLPDMNGKEFIYTLKERRQQPIPSFIVSTGNGSEHIAVDMMKLGARDYIVKDTYYLDKLPEVIKRIDKDIKNESKLKKAKDALKESERKYRNLFEKLYDVYFSLNNENTVTLVSPSIEKTFGYTPEEFIDNNIKSSFVNAKDGEAFLLLVGIDGSVINFEAQMKHKDNSVLWISINAKILRDNNGEPSSIEGVLRDITDQKQAENDIQALVESTAGIVGTDFFSKIVTLLCKWLNCENAILGEIGESSTILTLAAQIDNKPADNFSYNLTGTPCNIAIRKGFCAYPEDVCELFPEDRDLVDMNAVGYVGTPLLDSNNEIIGILCAISTCKLCLPKRAGDVINILAVRASAEIERMRMGKKQKELEIQLNQAQKMESIGTLAGGIAHDFNNILHPIYGYVEMIQEDLPENDPLQKPLKEVMTSAIRASGLVKQILTFSRQSEQDFQTLRMSLIIKESLELLRASLPSTIKIIQNFDDHCSMILADPTHIHQILMNLATNAFHAMEETGGVIKVGLSEVELAPEDLINPEMMPGYYSCLSFSDTGIGMDKKTAIRIFEPYFTTKGVDKGTGLGMSVVHGIVKSYNGDIRVNSEPGKGTTFRIYLPLVNAEEETTEATASEEVPGGTERILLVDDEPTIVRMHTLTLERLGYDVTPHNSSASALELFKSSPESFDLIITDMTMPDMTGIQLSQEIIAIRSGMPIILCTGFSNQINEEKAKKIGIGAYVMKPVLKNDIAKKIREVLDKN